MRTKTMYGLLLLAGLCFFWGRASAAEAGNALQKVYDATDPVFIKTAVGDLPEAAAIPEVPAPAAQAAVSDSKHDQPVTGNDEPVPCEKPAIDLKDGYLYRNGQMLGSNAVSFQSACSGDVAWQDSYAHLYKNKTDLGSSVRDYSIALKTGDVGWMDDSAHVYKNKDSLGSSAISYKVTWDGDVIWLNDFARLYKNSRGLGDSVGDYLVVDRTGDVVWRDDFRHLHKNDRIIADGVETFRASRGTGKLAWYSSSGRLYKEGLEVFQGEVREFEMSYAGVLSWSDMYGNYYSR